MKVYLFEDNSTTRDNMCTAAENQGFVAINAGTLPEALSLINNVTDDDVVSLDSQMPEAGDGMKIAEAIRKSGRKCLIVWHSFVEVPDAERLGIYPCSLPSNNWIKQVVDCKREWENKRNEYRYYEKKSPPLIALSRILTPFVALHLALQDSFDENGKPKDNPLIFDPECQKCCVDIRGLNKTLEDFLENVKNATEKQKTDIKGKYVVLKGQIDCLCEAIANNETTELANFKDLYEGHKSGNGLIGEFADELEKAVEAVEKGGKR